MSYEDLYAITGGRLEKMEEQMQMLSPADVGVKAYREIIRIYNRFAENGNIADFEAVANRLVTVTGSRI